jgi:ATP-binding cassette, subfamily C, bacterial
MGTTVVVVAQRWNILHSVDNILVLRDGAMEMVGPRKDVFAHLQKSMASNSSSSENAGDAGEPNV